jgi:hypothetical protein
MSYQERIELMLLQFCPERTETARVVHILSVPYRTGET